MFEIIFFLATLLLLFSIFLSIIVGLFVGVIYLIMYFIPIVDIVDTLIPAAILTTIPIILISNIFKHSLNKLDMYYNEDSEFNDD